MKKILFLTMTALLTSCTSNQQQTVKLSNEIDSLKAELSTYKEKYGELKTIDEKNNIFGIWELSHYVDDFGEKTQEGYIRTFCTGTFSNSATTNSELGVQFIIDKSGMRIQLYEYNRSHPIKGEGFFKFKAKRFDGETLEFKTYNAENGSNFVEEEYFEALMTFLQKEGEAKFIAESSSSSTLSNYKFSLTDTSYLKEALSKI